MDDLSWAAETARLIAVAKGDEKADLVIRGGRIVNVFTNEIYPADIAICGDRIAGLGRYEAAQVVDASGLILIPGLIDGHLHLESSLLTPAEFTKAVLPHGTTSVVIDPHEIANVGGPEAVRRMIAASENLPVTFYIMVPSCVPASPWETSGGRITAADVAELEMEPRTLGLAEVMDFPAILDADPEMLLKIGSSRGKIVDGHSPGLAGRDLNAYVAAGIHSDHECVTPEEAASKLRAGMRIMLREGSVTKNLDTLLPLVNSSDIERFLLVTDDLLPTDIEENGHIDHLLRKAVAAGMDPVWAVKMATLNTANHFGLSELGALAPGFKADIVAVKDLRCFQTEFVIKNGKTVYRGGHVLGRISGKKALWNEFLHSVRIGRLSLEDIRISAKPGVAHIIQVVPDQIVTEVMMLRPATLFGWVVSDVHRDILKLVVVERHFASGRVSTGLVSGFGLQRGAIASSVAHDGHNVVAVGADDEDILTAINEVVRMQGGLAVSLGGSIVASLPLPVAGLMSTSPAKSVIAGLRQVERAAAELGAVPPRPFMTLSFMCLSVVPKLKLTDRGLVDVQAGEIIDLFEDNATWAARSGSY